MSNHNVHDTESSVEIFGLNEKNAENMDVEDVASSNVFILDYIVDGSGSMYPFANSMVEALEYLKKAICGSKQANEMIVSKTVFNNTIYTGGYVSPADMNTDYYASGTTRLYDAIIDRHQRLKDYMNKLRDNGNTVRAAVVISSDGEDNDSQYGVSDAQKAIKDLLHEEITVAFIPFGDKAAGIANQLGIDPKNVKAFNRDESELRRMMDLVSKSAISASKNANNGSGSGGFFDV